MQTDKTKVEYPFLWAVIYGILLTAFAAFTLLDAFVLPRNIIYQSEIGQITTPAITAPTTEDISITNPAEPEHTGTDPVQNSDLVNNVDSNQQSDLNQSTNPGQMPEPSQSPEPEITESSYKNNQISITISEQEIYNTQVYIADIVLNDAGLLKTGLAGGAFGRNINEPTSAMAENCGAILAINGDFYGFRDRGYVMRNGYLYRDKARRSKEETDALVVYTNGDFDIISERDIDAKTLAEAGATQIFSFGPGLIKDSKTTVSEKDEVDQAMESNPRTAIGQIEPLHYVFVVSDGRTRESAGLTLWQLAQVMSDLGCETAYNLDGGGSATMWFMGTVVNHPTNGWKTGERSVSDIVYIGE